MTHPPTVTGSDRPRRDQEPRGRWENRCDFIKHTGTVAPLLVCDRPDGHRGMHSGRLVTVNSEGGRVMGYGRLRS